MKNEKYTVKHVVFADLDNQVETGTSIETIQAWSHDTIEHYCFAFRINNAHKLPPFKDATVNRYVELWLKGNK